MSGYFLKPKARDDLLAIGDYIARDNPIRGLSFVDELEEHCALLAAVPLSAGSKPQYGAGIRQSVHGRYLIFYRPIEEGIEVLRILHAARDIRPRMFR